MMDNRLIFKRKENMCVGVYLRNTKESLTISFLWKSYHFPMSFDLYLLLLDLMFLSVTHKDYICEHL